MKAGNDFAAKLMDALDDEGIKWRIYSGRGMFGKCCVGVYVGGEYSEQEVLQVVKNVDGALAVTRDQLGLGEIVYWPSAELIDDNEAKWRDSSAR